MKLTEQSIRKAYFSGKLNKLLDDISAEGLEDQNDLIILENLLPELEKEKKANEEKSAKYYGEVEPPSANELCKIDGEALKAWLEATKEEIKAVNKLIKIISVKLNSGKEFISRDQWLSYGFELLSNLNLLDNYVIVMEQLYRKKITIFIDEFGMSRAESEERARLTDEYREYKRSSMLRENALEVEMLCKKWAGQ